MSIFESYNRAFLKYNTIVKYRTQGLEFLEADVNKQKQNFEFNWIFMEDAQERKCEIQIAME